MSKIVFDIETVGQFNELDEETQEYILKNDEDEEERAESKKKVSLWPFTGQIVAIAMMNPETDKGKVYFQSGEEKIDKFSEDGIDYQICSEKEILVNFWRDIQNYQQIITFNGRGFDCPYLLLRSAVLKIKPTKNLMPNRYRPEFHLDLLDQLTFYGAFRKFSLDFYCRSLGIKSPKSGGMSGDKVNEAYQKGKYLEIARYCLADVVATAELYRIWEKYINV